MTIEGIGVDIEDISRFTGKPFPENKGFYERIFTKKEIEYCLQKANPYQHFAARFCAKEAVIKALSDETLDFRKIEILKETIQNSLHEKNLIQIKKVLEDGLLKEKRLQE